MSAEPRPAEPTGSIWPDEASRIPYAIYSDPEIYRREQELIFRGPFWCYVGLTCEVPNPGDFKRSFVGERPVIIARTRDGAISVVENRCAHRGASFCQQEFGHAKAFVCPYHSWTFGLDGKLLGVPFQRGVGDQPGMPPDFDAAEHGLTRLKVAERNGAIFSSYDMDAPPFEEYLGPKMLPWFDRVFNGRELVVLGYHRQRIRANWKLMLENIKDPYHASLLHVFFAKFGLVRPDQTNRVVIDETGMHSALVHQRAERAGDESVRELPGFKKTFALEDPRVVELIREFPGDATTVMQTIWPNVILQQSVNGLGPRVMHPRGPDCFDFVWTAIGYADDTPEMRAHRLRQANLFGPSGFVSADDGEVMEFLQRGLGPCAEEDVVVAMGGHGVEDTGYLVTEAAIRKCYRFYREVMKL